ncbi:MAG: ABC transporter substrate-binding protein [Clostridia bacterium]|nr:ABC transporter substrate-binding protein [Clostridia bacterium]
MKIMKKIALFALAVTILACCFSSCGSKGITLDELKNAGELVIATSPDFPPFESLDGDGNVFGIEIDILNAICEDLGVKLKIEQMDFESVLPGVESGKFNVGVSGISVTPKREKNTLFTKPYCYAAQAIVVKAGSSITCKADLTGKKVSVQTSTTAEEFCMNNGYDVLSFTANNDAQSALLQGKVDAWVIDDLTAADMVAAYNAEHPGELVILGDAMTTEPYAFALAFGSEDVVAEMNKTIDRMLKDGSIAKIFEKYNAPFTAPDAQ